MSEQPLSKSFQQLSSVFSLLFHSLLLKLVFYWFSRLAWKNVRGRNQHLVGSVITNLGNAPVPLSDITKGIHYNMKHFCEKITPNNIDTLCVSSLPQLQYMFLFPLTILKEVGIVVAHQPAMKEPDWSILNRTVFLFNIPQVK